MKVDIILPTYMGERWVGEAIDSVLAQTYTNWYLTVVDDASTDATVQRVEAFRILYPDRIRLIRLEKNKRAAGARMEAIRKSNGDIIAFLDQDDHWRPLKLEKQIQRLKEQPIVQAVHTDVEHMDETGRIISGSADRENRKRKANDYDNLERHKLLEIMFTNKAIRLGTTAIVRRSFENIGGFNESLFGGEDWEFWIRFADRWRIGHIAEPLVERRLHMLNTSSHYRRFRNAGLIESLGIVHKAYPQFGNLIKKRRKYLLKRSIITEFENDMQPEAYRHARELLSINPLDIISFCLVIISCSGFRGNLIIKFVLSKWGRRIWLRK